MTVYFCNDGIVDMEMMMTFGVSAKEKPDAIGYFGTGLKYAIAIILRIGGKISITSGPDTWEFTTEEKSVRGKTFNIVMVNGTNAGFTTHLGINWEPWMAYRELSCNCTDEGGDIGFEPSNADTCIQVDCHEVEQAHIHRAEYFIEGTPLYTSNGVHIHKEPKPYFYYRGVAIAGVGEVAPVFSYNVTTHVTLTEDRTPRYSWQLTDAIQQAIQQSTSTPMLRRILTTERCFESTLNPVYSAGVSDEYLDTARDLINSGQPVSESVRSLLKHIAELDRDWPEHKITAVQQTMLDNAIIFLTAIGLDMSHFPIRIVKGLGRGVMGRAADGVIYLSELPFNMGTKQLASTVMEEWVHNVYGCEDFDREMQNWLFDKILSIGEEMQGKPL